MDLYHLVHHYNIELHPSKFLIPSYSSFIKTELIKRSSLQLEEAKVSDLLFPLHSSSNQHYYDIYLVAAVLESFLLPWKRTSSTPTRGSSGSKMNANKIMKNISGSSFNSD